MIMWAFYTNKLILNSLGWRIKHKYSSNSFKDLYALNWVKKVKPYSIFKEYDLTKVSWLKTLGWHWNSWKNENKIIKRKFLKDYQNKIYKVRERRIYCFEVIL